MSDHAMTDSPWMTTVEAAAYLKVSPQTIRQACRDEKLQHAQPGGTRGQIRLRREWLDAWMEEHTYGVPSSATLTPCP